MMLLLTSEDALRAPREAHLDHRGSPVVLSIDVVHAVANALRTWRLT